MQRANHPADGKRKLPSLDQMARGLTKLINEQGYAPDHYPEGSVSHVFIKAAELAGLKRGYYLLNTDGGNRADPLGRAAIGALLRTRRLVTVAQMSKAIGPATHNVAEYQALIEGLELAREYGVQRIRVYMDSEIVVDQVNGVSAVRQGHLSELHKEARRLVDQFKSFRVSWVPRELNTEADRLVNDALGAPA